MSHLTRQRQIRNDINASFEQTRPAGFDQWVAFWNEQKTHGRKFIDAVRWIIHRTNPGQTRRDLLAALRASYTISNPQPRTDQAQKLREMTKPLDHAHA